MGHVAIYCRISQDTERLGLGVARQEQACQELAERKALGRAESYIDNDVSAYAKRRPQYERMLEGIRTGEVSAVVVFHTDRLHRQPSELEDYIRACEALRPAVPTYTVQGGELDLSTPDGRMTARVLGAMASRESELKASRAKHKAEQDRRSGRYVFGAKVPFGWTLQDGKPVLNEPVADMLRQAHYDVLNGTSVSSVAQALNTAGHVSRNGKQWGHHTARQLFLRSHNAGITVNPETGEKLADSEMPAIVSEDVWRSVVATLTRPERRTSRDNAVQHLLSGIMLCHCGSVMRAKRRGKATGHTWSYVCIETAGASATANKGKVERHCSRRIEPVDTEALNALRWALELGVTPAQIHKAQDGQSVEEASAELYGLRTRRDHLEQLFNSGGMDIEQFARMNGELRVSIQHAEQQLSLAREAQGALGITTDDVDAYLAGLDIEKKRHLIRSVLRITCYPAEHSRTPLSECLEVVFRAGQDGQTWTALSDQDVYFGYGPRIARPEGSIDHDESYIVFPTGRGKINLSDTAAQYSE
ncbi:recombinase family protein [Kocuria oceani]|uniref:Recombinase family protein n=1 Tax=Kocuria oceani TaxID=988827 RepID=A0ABV9TGG0_9MICC|nr:recombinase family protein [Kocuria oceani]